MEDLLMDDRTHLQAEKINDIRWVSVG